MRTPKFTVFSLIVIAAFNVGVTGQQRWPQYPKVEAYEVRPGVLMIPRYTANSEICEFGLEALQYSPDLIRVSSELSGDQIFHLLDELIPGSDRGKPLKKSDTQISQRGRSVVVTTTSDYENVVRWSTFPGHESLDRIRQMKVSRSRFYDYRKRLNCENARRKTAADLVDACFWSHLRRYGSRRIPHELKMGRFLVRRLMREQGLVAIQAKLTISSEI